jgi:hypothetical protein
VMRELREPVGAAGSGLEGMVAGGIVRSCMGCQRFIFGL